MTAIQNISTSASAEIDLPWISNHSLLAALILAGAALLVYWPSLGGTFIMDDDRYLTNNAIISSSDGLYRIWFTPELIDYWPMTYSSFWLEWRLWATNPVGYRVTNLALHTITCLLLWKILRKLSVPGAFLAALVYVIHPINVEAVAWISQRNELLAAFFLMASILSYLLALNQHTSDSTQIVWYCLSVAAFLLAVFSKSSAAIEPLVLLLILWWLRHRFTIGDLLRIALFLGLAALLVCVEIGFQEHGDPHANAPFSIRCAGAGAVVWFYLSKALLPINLAFVYSHWDIRTSQLLWWIPLAATLGSTLLLGWRNISARPAGRWLLFAWAYYCLALLPVMGFAEAGFMAHSLVADRYQHLALIGVAAIVAAAWWLRTRALPPSSRSPAYIIAGFVLVALAVLTFQRNRLYGDPVKLFATSVATNPESHLAEVDLAIALEKSGKIQEAIEHCQHAIKLNPDFYIGHNVLGVLLEDAGQHEQAMQHYQEALRLHPNFPEALNNLGLLLAGLGRSSEAIQQYEKALGYRPDFAEVHVNLGNALLDSGHAADAMQQYQLALQINPDLATAHFNIANFLAAAGRTDEAIDHYRHAVRVRPDYAEAHFNLGVAFGKTGKMQQAIEQFQQCLRLQPNFADAHNNLGNALFAVGRTEDALDQFATARRLKPEDGGAYFNQAKAYASLNRTAEAIAAAQTGMEVARSHAQQELAGQIETWLKDYLSAQARSQQTKP